MENTATNLLLKVPTYEPKFGVRIAAAASEMVELYRPSDPNTYAYLVFNGIPLQCTSESTVESLVAEYHVSLRLLNP